MDAKREIEWKGWGRWLSFATSALLILIAVPFVFDHGLGSYAGWNIFLGLLLFGTITSGNRKAPLLALILTGLMALRLVVGIVSGSNVIEVVMGLLMLAMTTGAAYDLRKQVTSANG